MKKIFVTLMMLLPVMVMAQVDQIVGDWTTVDDKSGDHFSVVRIFKATNGLYYGKIAKMLVGEPGMTCEECEGADHGKPMEGLIIIRDMKAVDGELREGKVLDPQSGKIYYAKIYLEKGQLILRGSLDKRGFLGRNQTWIKAQ